MPVVNGLSLDDPRIIEVAQLTGADVPVFTLAPAVVYLAAIMTLLVIPFAPGLGVADLNIGILFFLAVSSMEIVGLFMAGCHVGHDCQLGDRVILVNNASLAGHCHLDDDVIIGGLSGVHQFVRIGRGAMIGAVALTEAGCGLISRTAAEARPDRIRTRHPRTSR